MSVPRPTIACCLLAFLSCCLIGCKPTEQADAGREKSPPAGPPPNKLVGKWKAVGKLASPIGNAATGSKFVYLMDFLPNGAVQTETAQTTGGGPFAGRVMRCQGTYQFNGGTLNQQLSSCESCLNGGSCTTIGVSDMPSRGTTSQPINFENQNAMTIGLGGLVFQRQ